MAIIPTIWIPTHSGEMLLKKFLDPMGITQRDVAQAIFLAKSEDAAALGRIKPLRRPGWAA